MLAWLAVVAPLALQAAVAALAQPSKAVVVLRRFKVLQAVPVEPVALLPVAAVAAHHSTAPHPARAGTAAQAWSASTSGEPTKLNIHGSSQCRKK
jgi:hypothetical protein